LGITNGIESRTAEAVHRGAGHIERQAGQQRAHARDVAVVFAGLVGAAENHVAHGLPIELGMALHQRAQRHRAKVVGAHRRQCTAIAAERRANGVADEGMMHGGRLR